MSSSFVSFDSVFVITWKSVLDSNGIVSWLIGRKILLIPLWLWLALFKFYMLILTSFNGLRYEVFTLSGTSLQYSCAISIGYACTLFIPINAQSENNRLINQLHFFIYLRTNDRRSNCFTFNHKFNLWTLSLTKYYWTF